MPPSSSNARWVFSTQGVDGTLAIGASFVFLAYVLHPAIESAYKRVRAYRAWRATEKSQSVDVTNYHMMEEFFGGRGKWDAARIISLLLAAFSLASWGLELTVDLAYYEGNADLLNRPPPVTIRNVNGTKDWQVKSMDMLGHADWRDLPNMFEDSAKSRYYMEASTGYEGPVNGEIKVAHWYTEAARTPSQFHYIEGMNATVKDLQCTDNEVPDVKSVYSGDEIKWGDVYECVKGPSLTDDLLLLYEGKAISPPTIVMTRSDGQIFIVVEESSTYPSFLYSVWTVGRVDGTSTELIHEFHIASTMRLAEAVVTGIVHGEISGGGCFGLFRQFSETREVCETSILRASPFGEHPTGATVQIQEFEHVEVGLKISANALACFVCLVVLAVISATWLFMLSSSIGMDVYDRDELIRAVSTSGTTAGSTLPSEMRILVRKGDSGEIIVIVNDSLGTRSGCERILQKASKMVKDAVPSLKATVVVAPCSDGFADAIEPTRSRAVVLEGKRPRLSKSASDPNRFFRRPKSVSLTASPVPSSATSVSGMPARYPWQPAPVAHIDPGYKDGRGASVFFDTVTCADNSEGGGNGVSPVSRDKPVQGDSGSGACTSVVVGRRGSSYTLPVTVGGEVSTASERGRPWDVEVAEQSNCSTDVSKGLSPLPPLFRRSGSRFGPPLSHPLTHGCDETSLESPRCTGDVC